MSRLLILGGSYQQIGLIETAVKNDHDITVIDRDEKCLASSISNIKFKAIDLSDIQAVSSLIQKNKFDAVIPPVSELGNSTAVRLAEKFGYNYNSIDTVEATTKKIFMRERLKNSGLKEPKTRRFLNVTNVKNEFSLPLIVKPSMSSASRGVTLVNDYERLEAAINYAKQISGSTEMILIEEYIQGDQYSIETISSNYQHHVVGITREVMSGPPYFIERTDIISKEISNELEESIQNYVEVLLNCFDIKVGPCHIEVKITPSNEIYLIEIASRSGMLRDRLIETSGGTDYNELIIRSYLGDKISSEVILSPKYNALLGVMNSPDDLKKYLQAKEDGVIFKEQFLGKGPVVDPKTLTDAFGYFFVRSDDDVKKYIL